MNIGLNSIEESSENHNATFDNEYTQNVSIPASPSKQERPLSPKSPINFLIKQTFSPKYNAPKQNFNPSEFTQTKLKAFKKYKNKILKKIESKYPDNPLNYADPSDYFDKYLKKIFHDKHIVKETVVGLKNDFQEIEHRQIKMLEEIQTSFISQINELKCKLNNHIVISSHFCHQLDATIHDYSKFYSGCIETCSNQSNQIDLINKKKIS